MTTIAVDLDRQAMASDSRCTSGDPDFATKKIYKAKDGTLIGYAGTVVDGIRFCEWIQAGADRSALPTFNEADFSALTLNKDGCLTWDYNCVPMEMRSRFYAIGSGGMAAMTAHFLGYTLEDSVDIACQIDSKSGAPIVVEFYKEVKRPARRAPTKTIKTGAKK